MQELIIRDVRLQGGKPRGTEVLEVDENTPLDWPVLWAKTKSDAYGGNVYLRIAVTRPKLWIICPSRPVSKPEGNRRVSVREDLASSSVRKI